MFAVIEIPVLSLQSILRLKKERPKGPLAVLDETGQRSFICEVNPAAAQEGVEVGMRPAQALARCGELQMLVRSQETEAPVERLLLLLAQSLAPRVEHTRPGVATIDLSGRRKDHVEAAAEALIDRFKSLRIHIRIGISDTPEHALWGALFAKPLLSVNSIDTFLKRVPITIAEADSDLIEILHSWGIHHMFALRQLPRDEIGHRLGQRGLQLWDAVAGRNPRLLQPTKPKPDFQRQLQLEHRVESVRALLFILKRFVDELALELESAQAAAYILSLHLKLDNKNTQTQRIEVPEPSSRASTLFRILETALENLQTEDAIIGVCLKLEVTEAHARQGDFFSVAMEDAAAFAETADRIATIVGKNRSGSPRLRDTWRPDDFYITTLNSDLGTKENAPTIPDEGIDPRLGLPLSRFRPPRAIRVELEGKRPSRIDNGPYAGPIKDAHGPWKSSGDWWEPSKWAREEWDVEMQGGGLFRIFRQHKHWYLEGIYG